MKVLLTNDDGIEAAGLWSMRRELCALGMDVVVVAPDSNRSGAARRCTPRRPVRFTARHQSDGPVYACDGSPVDCVRGALLTDRAADVDAVVAGVNHGLNVGDDALYSGTVGAAVEAALLSRPGLAFSQQPDTGDFRFRDRGPHTFEPGTHVAARLVAAVAEDPPPGRFALTVNLPAGVEMDSGLDVTRLSRRTHGVGRVVAEPDDADLLHLYGLPEDPEPALEFAPGTDAAALRAGRVSLTPLSLDWHDPARTADLDTWARRLVAGGLPATLRSDDASARR
ncbi:5'/3'-nucleotidase SurE [Phytoactinopolyspora alkaliphila]|uniref:5'-nucleotidase SurE n=1 Tax=Phytoactinopolyspora alkaliphila TaxID=1783498 RepID=A0A6N9YR61_9ACTN|nr:5'/3'-nucleotidase SurE [Phytoactinopolyspora alkaliphila]NED97437.1 5'/3'-nucleotidase SurE [Phytoactinopolyspora alkaliphila]